MQDTFQWTDELVQEFVQFTLHQSPAFQGRYTDMEQFKSSKSPKKEWEIVEVFCEGSDPVPAYQPEGWTKEWVEGQIKLGGLQIHSVRRLSDDWTVSVKDKVKTVSGKIGTIQAINADGHILFSDITGLEHITTIQKLPQPILTTIDGVEIFDLDNFRPTVVFDDWSTNINADRSLWETGVNHYGGKLFSSNEVAQKYILENKPVLSLNDVKRIRDKQFIQFPLDLLGELTALVKQKLNQ